jgi:hypothetical protein
MSNRIIHSRLSEIIFRHMRTYVLCVEKVKIHSNGRNRLLYPFIVISWELKFTSRISDEILFCHLIQNLMRYSYGLVNNIQD